MSVIYVMFKITVRVNFEQITQLRSCVNTIFSKIRKSVNSSDIINLIEPCIAQMRYMEFSSYIYKEREKEKI